MSDTSEVFMITANTTADPGVPVDEQDLEELGHFLRTGRLPDRATASSSNEAAPVQPQPNTRFLPPEVAEQYEVEMGLRMANPGAAERSGS